MKGTLSFERLYNLGNFNNAKYSISFEQPIGDVTNTELVEAVFGLFEVVSDISWINYGLLKKEEDRIKDLANTLEFLEQQKIKMKDEIKQLLNKEND